MGDSTKPGGRKASTQLKRAQIRHAAYSCFRDAGYYATTVDAICRKTGISKGSFYWHYESKQEVFVDILETWTREVMDELYMQFEDALSHDDYAVGIAEALEREVHRGRAIVPLWLEFTAHARREPEIQTALSRFYRRARAAIAEMLRPLMKGRFNEPELQGVAATIFGAYAGLMMQDLSDPEWANAAEAMRSIMTVLARWVFQLPTPASFAQEIGEVPPFSSAHGKNNRKVTRVDNRELGSLVMSEAPDAWRRVAELRDLILRVAPDANERIITGWKVIGYDLGGLFCALKARRTTVQVIFYHGASLSDPKGLLEGNGKRQRFVDVRLEDAFDSDALEALVRAAVANRQQSD